MAAPDFTNGVKTEAGLQELNTHLATRSFVGGGPQATQEDIDLVSKITNFISMKKLPHVCRWLSHIRALKTAFPYRRWPRPTQAVAGGGDKPKDQGRMEGLLVGAIHGKVCTRFPPEPSGFLHIGHVKAALLNNHYARTYGGKLILRFDDTNPTKEKAEFEESIIADLKTLQVVPDQVCHTSDHFDFLQGKMEEMIKNGKAYVDDTPMLKMREERDAGTASARRSASVDENVRLWKEILKGSEEGLKCCVRGKLDMTSKNKCLRDPVFYRCKTDTPHHRHGNKFKAYPTYDFACPIVDAHEGVTHALRTIEYKDRDDMYKWVQENAGVRTVELCEFSKMQFNFTVLSKRKLAWFVENGHVTGWDDPRFPTVQGVLRHGMTVEGLSEFVLTQGMSKATNFMEWDKIWAINKQKIDPIVPRYAAVQEGAVVLKLDGPPSPICKLDKKHPKNDALGDRIIIQCNEVLVEQDDAQDIAEGEQITLLHWGNAYIDKVTKNEAGQVVSMVGRLNPEGNVKDTKKRIHWVGNLPEQTTPVVLRELGHLVTKAKIEDDDEIEDIVNKESIVDTAAIGDPLLKTLNKGDMLQLERRGFFIVDSISLITKSPMVLIKIPDGKSKDMGIKSKVDVAQLQGANVAQKSNKGGKKEAAAPTPATAPEPPKADTVAEVKEGGKKEKAKAKAAPAKSDERPLDDISRLNLRVGRVVKVWPHATAEKLFCEEVNLGEATVRTIASGLRAHLKEEDLLDKLVVVLANLKPRKMQGFESMGMVMCATGADGKIELLQPPDGSKVGERVMVEGVEMAEPDDKLNEKTGKAPWVVLSEGCRTTDSCQASYKGAVWLTSAGQVSAKTVAGGSIS